MKFFLKLNLLNKKFIFEDIYLKAYFTKLLKNKLYIFNMLFLRLAINQDII